MFFNFFTFGIIIYSVFGQFEWQIKDAFDEIQTKMNQVTADNCETLKTSQLVLPANAVPQIPSVRKIDPIFVNRTMLRHIHDVSLNRAVFYSFIYAKANESEQPGLAYYYASHIADVSSNYYVNGSGLYFSPNSSYSNFYRDYFNKTMPYFAPYAFRSDDFLDIYNPNRLPTLKTVKATDLGANSDDFSYFKYDRKDFWKINDWYSLWLPDDTRDLSKSQYHVIMKYVKLQQDTAMSLNHTLVNDFKYHAQGIVGPTLDIPYYHVTEDNFAFFGPPDPSRDPGPVKWTKPYFDCRRSNKWIVSASTPVIDYFPRHTIWRHLRKHKYVAVTTTDIDFIRIDINPCPKMAGNEAPNIFAGIARCKNTTVCEPLSGYGFRRGGYQCVCKPNHRLPPLQKGPFLGEHIEKATQREYEMWYDCIPNGRVETYPFPSQVDDGEEFSPLFERSSGSSNYMNYANSQTGLLSNNMINPILPENENLQHKRTKRSSYAHNAHEYLNTFFQTLNSFDNQCGNRKTQHLNDLLSATKKALFGIEEAVISQAYATFEMQAKIADRTAHFLSYYLQRVNPYDTFTDRLTDQLLTVDQLYGEVLANVMSGYKIIGSGIFFDHNAFQARDGIKRPFFAPYAHTMGENVNFYTIVDRSADSLNGPFFSRRSAAVTSEGGFWFDYTEELPYFRLSKEKWSTLKSSSDPRLSRYNNYIHIRSNPAGDTVQKYENFPDSYYTASNGQGRWHGPFYVCDNQHDKGNVEFNTHQDFFVDNSFKAKRKRSTLNVSNQTFSYNNENNNNEKRSPQSVRNGGKWILTYAIPFFGLANPPAQNMNLDEATGKKKEDLQLNTINKREYNSLAFKGIVTVDVALSDMDINQCPYEYGFGSVNPFQGSDKCHYDSQYCVFLPGKGLVRGAYKCECRQGYEYPFNMPKTYFEGDEMETEYERMKRNKSHRYDLFKCRIAAATLIRPTSFFITIFLTGVTFLLSKICHF